MATQSLLSGLFPLYQGACGSRLKKLVQDTGSGGNEGEQHCPVLLSDQNVDVVAEVGWITGESLQQLHR